jgi:hypothetical protein
MSHLSFLPWFTIEVLQFLVALWIFLLKTGNILEKKSIERQSTFAGITKLVNFQIINFTLPALMDLKQSGKTLFS